MDGARRADEIEHAALDLRDHRVGRGETADADHRFAGQGLGEGDIGFLIAFLGIARIRAVDVTPGLQVPEIGFLADQLEERGGLLVPLQPQSTDQLVGGNAHRDRTGIAHGVLRILDHFLQQPHAVFDGSAVLIGALIGARREELMGAKAHAGIDVDDIEAGPPGALGGIDLPTAQGLDVGLVHGPGLQRKLVLAGTSQLRQARGRERHFPAVAVGHHAAAIEELDRRQGAVPVDRLGHQREVGNVLIGPQAGIAVRTVIGGGMDRAISGGDHGPPRPRHGCHAARHGFAPSPDRTSWHGAPGRIGCAPSPARCGPARRECRIVGYESSTTLVTAELKHMLCHIAPG